MLSFEIDEIQYLLISWNARFQLKIIKRKHKQNTKIFFYPPSPTSFDSVTSFLN